MATISSLAFGFMCLLSYEDELLSRQRGFNDLTPINTW